MKKKSIAVLLFSFLLTSISTGNATEIINIEKKKFPDIDDISYTIEFIVRKGKDGDKFLDTGHAYIIWRKKQNNSVIYDKQLFISSIDDIAISNYTYTPSKNDSSIFSIYPKEYDTNMYISFKTSFCKIDGNNDYTDVSFLQAGGYIAYMCDTKQAFGFYPLEQPTPISLTVPGTVEDEFTNSKSSTFEPTHKMIVNVDALTFETTRMTLLEWKLFHNRYRPLSMDCVTFTQEVATEIGLSVPGRSLSTIKPEGYIKELIELNRSTNISPVATQIHSVTGIE